MCLWCRQALEAEIFPFAGEMTSFESHVLGSDTLLWAPSTPHHLPCGRSSTIKKAHIEAYQSKTCQQNLWFWSRPRKDSIYNKKIWAIKRMWWIPSSFPPAGSLRPSSFPAPPSTGDFPPAGCGFPPDNGFSFFILGSFNRSLFPPLHPELPSPPVPGTAASVSAAGAVVLAQPFGGGGTSPSHCLATSWHRTATKGGLFSC